MGEKLIVNSGGDLLGRKNGAHAGFLGSFAYISGTHAIVKQEGGRWFIIDQGSSNGTRVDGIDSEPNKQIELKSNGKLELADQEFIILLWTNILNSESSTIYIYIWSFYKKSVFAILSATILGYFPAAGGKR